MRCLDFLLHLFTPRHSNGHRARLLHGSSISLLITIVIIFQLFVSAISHLQPQVLGYATNISISDLLTATNSKRASAGLAALSLNDQLDAAAAAKGSDMFANQYWAHNSPSGKEPWSFITSAGYNYLFAGENLARDFGDSNSVVEAWMNSPSHRENLLNERYKDVGFAVVNGKYGDSETTLVVQMFGAKTGTAPSVAAPVVAAKPTLTPSPTVAPITTITEIPSSPAAVPTQAPPVEIVPQNPIPPSGLILNTQSTKVNPYFDIPTLTRNVTLALTLFIVALLILDSALVYARRTVRVSGHNFAHLLILFALLIAMNIIGRGIVL